MERVGRGRLTVKSLKPISCSLMASVIPEILFGDGTFLDISASENITRARGEIEDDGLKRNDSRTHPAPTIPIENFGMGRSSFSLVDMVFAFLLVRSPARAVAEQRWVFVSEA